MECPHKVVSLREFPTGLNMAWMCDWCDREFIAIPAVQESSLTFHEDGKTVTWYRGEKK